MDEEFWYEVAGAALSFAKRTARPEEVVTALRCLLTPFMQNDNYPRFFKLFEAEGIHLTPVHFYSPVPDTRSLSRTLFDVDSELPGIRMNDQGQLQFLREHFPRFRQEYDRLPHRSTDNPLQYAYENDFFFGLDAGVLYAMIRHFRPNLIIEIGSGFSTLLSVEAAQQNGQTEIIAVEPFPSELLMGGLPHMKELIKKPVQSLEPDFFRQLGDRDILFIDSSHVSQAGSDVNYLYLEILPRLRPGVVVHIHDIYLPRAGRADWVLDQARFWNEQYLLQAFLIMNTEFDVLFANHYMRNKYPDEVRAAFPCAPHWEGGSFWIRRTVHPDHAQFDRITKRSGASPTRQ